MAIRCEWMSASTVIMQKRDGGVLMKHRGARTGRVIEQQRQSSSSLGQFFRIRLSSPPHHEAAGEDAKKRTQFDVDLNLGLKKKNLCVVSAL